MKGLLTKDFLTLKKKYGIVRVLLVLGFWSKLTNNSIMWFVVDNFEFCTFIGFLSSIAIYILSYILSINFFKKKHI